MGGPIMFQGFAGVWTPVARARDLKRRPMPIELAGERVVLFRGEHGAPAALVDRCPHGGTRLSLGAVTRDGRLECPLDGWRFDAGGACAEVPLYPEAPRHLLSATALPARQAGGLVWLRTSIGARASDGPDVPRDLEDPRLGHASAVAEWRCHWTRAVEVLLYPPHREILSRRAGAPNSQFEVLVRDTPRGFAAAWVLDGAPADAHLEFTRPNGMTVHFTFAGSQVRLHSWCVPLSRSRTRIFLASSRNFGLWHPVVDRLAWRLMRARQPLAESSEPSEAPLPTGERAIASDRAARRFRRYYLDRLRKSSAAPTGGWAAANDPQPELDGWVRAW